MSDEQAQAKYGVNDLADLLGITAFTTRARLRSLGYGREGRRYGWNTKSELDTVVKQIQQKQSPDKAPKKEKAKVKAVAPKKEKAKAVAPKKAKAATPRKAKATSSHDEANGAVE